MTHSCWKHSLTTKQCQALDATYDEKAGRTELALDLVCRRNCCSFFGIVLGRDGVEGLKSDLLLVELRVLLLVHHGEGSIAVGRSTKMMAGEEP